MIKKNLRYDPYGTDVWFLLGTAAEINKFLNIKFDDTDDHIAHGVRANFMEWTPDSPKEHAIYYIAVAKDRTKDRFDQTCALAHEVVHFVMHIFDKRGVRYDHDHDEAFAYYYEWIFRQCLQELHK